MSIHIRHPDLTWSPGTDYISCAALNAALAAWAGTPYESGQRFIGRGADCIGAVFGVIDLADGRDRAAFPGLPHDTAMHNRPTAIAAMRELIKRYDPVTPVSGSVVEPGDLVITGAPGGGPGHVAIVGPMRNHLWHAMPDVGFHQGGWGLFDEQVLFGVYRIGDKERWGRWQKDS